MSTLASSTLATSLPRTSVPASTAAAPATVPWYIPLGALAITSATIGGAWDVSWHRTIGRDTFWTPAHMAIYACGLLAGIICAYLILRTTFGSAANPETAHLRAASVNVLGLRAPIGAFLAAWGGIAMLTSAPFDNWWHAAYGLDVKIVSPPHTLLILGLRGVAVGVLFLTLAAMNRARTAAPNPASSPGAPNRTYTNLRRLFLYIGGLALGGQMFFLQEYTWDVKLHTASAYIAMAIAVPLIFAIFSEVSGYRWAATSTAAVYTLIILGEILILPLFPATPKLGPVFNPVTHLVPAKFPILLLAPAFALDLLWQRLRTSLWKPWQIALLSGVLFVAVLTAVEWPFANFLLSHRSENRFFGTIYFDYNSRPDGFDRLRRFFQPSSPAAMSFALLRASLYAAISTLIGLSFGRWMRTVQR